jgi:plastocyanin domain-containing protein
VNFSSGVTLANVRLPEFRTAAPSLEVSPDTKRLETTFRVQPDIQPSAFTTKIGQKTALIVNVQDEGQGCMSTIMIPGLFDKPLLLQKGKQLVLEFTPKSVGTYQITCAMGIPRGTIKVES